MTVAPVRTSRGRCAQARGIAAETLAAEALERDGWEILARRLRTLAGEIDLVAQKSGLLAVVEVKSRRHLGEAAAAVSPRQRTRLIAAADQVLAEHPDWGAGGMRFDILVVDAENRVRRIADAFREGMLA